MTKDFPGQVVLLDKPASCAACGRPLDRLGVVAPLGSYPPQVRKKVQAYYCVPCWRGKAPPITPLKFGRGK